MHNFYAVVGWFILLLILMLDFFVEVNDAKLYGCIILSMLFFMSVTLEDIKGKL